MSVSQVQPLFFVRVSFFMRNSGHVKQPCPMKGASVRQYRIETMSWSVGIDEGLEFHWNRSCMWFDLEYILSRRECDPECALKVNVLSVRNMCLYVSCRSCVSLISPSVVVASASSALAGLWSIGSLVRLKSPNMMSGCIV